MCGICGTTAAGDGRSLAAINAALAHRGPDDEGLHIDRAAGVGLAARRLAIIDVEGGHQPIANEDRAVWAVLNGEIYNHPSLQQHLRRRGHRLRSRTDTEVLVHLYEDHGARLVHAIEGMYALAVWDARARRLLLARDRFGEKPLFYALRGGDLWFASELTALLRGLPGGLELDPAGVDAYLRLGYVPGPGSIAQGVRQLPPGSTLTWDAKRRRAEVETYWAPPPSPERNGARYGDLVAETRELLERSVRSRLISDVPLGVFLSGGVDSTLIAALAAREAAQPLRTFTVGYQDGDVNETGAAGRIAAALDTEHSELILGASDVGPAFDRAVGRLDQPLADQAFVALAALARYARRDVTVAVGGEGADELFGGYPRYRWLARAERLRRRLPKAVSGSLAAALGRLPGSRASRLGLVLAPVEPLERHLAWVGAGRGAPPAAVRGPQLGPSGSAPPFELALAGSTIDDLFMRLDQAVWLPGDVLAKADRATMLASLEMRTPYLSRELAEFAATVPAPLHTRGRGKGLLREVLDRIDRESGATQARKLAFRVPAAQWLRGPLAPALREAGHGPLYEQGWLNAGAVERLTDEHLAGRTDRSAALWPVLVLARWFESAVDGAKHA
jgi:asparagine synthase (glutamine-hydrolysing)